MKLSNVSVSAYRATPIIKKRFSGLDPLTGKLTEGQAPPVKKGWATRLKQWLKACFTPLPDPITFTEYQLQDFLKQVGAQLDAKKVILKEKGVFAQVEAGEKVVHHTLKFSTGGMDKLFSFTVQKQSTGKRRKTPLVSYTLQRGKSSGIYLRYDAQKQVVHYSNRDPFVGMQTIHPKLLVETRTLFERLETLTH